MLEYVKRLLLAQTKLAAQFDTAPAPEVREVSLHARAAEEDGTEEQAREEGKPRGAKTDEAAVQAGSAQQVEDKLREMTRRTMRMESMQMQAAARENLEQTRKLERAMTALQARQTVDLTKITPESAAGGMMGSYRQTMQSAGVASSASQWSMQEISRFFERDARRYG